MSDAALLSEVKKVVENGGVILYPSDTIWGLGCDPNNEEALEKIITLKQRVQHQSFIVLVDSERKLQMYTESIPQAAYDIIDYAERPTTIVYETGKNVSSKVLHEDGSIAIRFCRDGFCKQILQRLKTGLVSTSANISGQPFDGTFVQIDPDIQSQVDMIVQPTTPVNTSKPSSIIRIDNDSTVKIIRK